MQEFIGCTKFPVNAPFSTRHWRRQIPLFHNVSNSIGSLTPVHPFDVSFDLIIIDYFPLAFSPNVEDRKKR